MSMFVPSLSWQIMLLSVTTTVWCTQHGTLRLKSLPPAPPVLTPVSLLLLLLLLPDISRVSCSKPGSRSPAGRPPTPRNASHRDLCAYEQEKRFHVKVFVCAFDPKHDNGCQDRRTTNETAERNDGTLFVSFRFVWFSLTDSCVTPP